MPNSENTAETFFGMSMLEQLDEYRCSSEYNAPDFKNKMTKKIIEIHKRIQDYNAKD